MILTIDNQTGAGALDYSSALAADAPLEIVRTLNAASRATASLLLPASLPTPTRRARVVISSDAGAVLFTGYIATESVAIYAGAGLTGPVYRIAFSAVSDEWLLDKQSLTLTGAGFSVTGGSLLATLANRTGQDLLTTSQVQPGNAIGVFTPEPAKPFSANAAAIAGSTYAAYRALDGALSTQTIGSTTHTLDFDSGAATGSPSISALKTTSIKELANDVTVAGAIEPTAFVTEMFQGDGATSVFQLSGEPFRNSNPNPAVRRFSEPSLNTQLWNLTDPGSHLSLGPNGLTLTGGTGADGQTTLAAIDQVELGGTLLLTPRMSSSPHPPTESSAASTPAPSPAPTASPATTSARASGADAAHALRQRSRDRNQLHITPRPRLYAPHPVTFSGECSAFCRPTTRVSTARSNPSAAAWSIRPSPSSSTSSTWATPPTRPPPSFTTAPPPAPSPPRPPLHLRRRELASSSPAPSAPSPSPETGSAWIASTPPTAPAYTRLIGLSGQGVDCRLSDTGKVTFFAGRIPLPGELVTVSYRIRSRAVARLDDPASITAEIRPLPAGSATSFAPSPAAPPTANLPPPPSSPSRPILPPPWPARTPVSTPPHHQV